MLDCGFLPHWLETLLKEKFFNACIIHEAAKKNEKNVFCLDCCDSLCPHCLPFHASHRLLQIRRYVYNDVIRLSDAEKLMNCAFVQRYITNKAKVVFLNQRPQTRQCKGTYTPCLICDRALQESSKYCSLFCKLQHLMETDHAKLFKAIYKCEHLTLPEPGSDDGLMTPDSVLEPDGSMRTESGSSGSGGTAGFMGCQQALACTATTEVVRKKRSSGSGSRSAFRPVVPPVCEVTVAMSNRRKNRPQRSPLY